MWEWDDYCDEQGVYNCITALEKLATDKAVKSIRAVAHGSTSYHSGDIYLDSVHSLARLGRLIDLIELVLSDRHINDSVIDAFSEFEAAKVILEINKFLEREMDGENSIVLQQLKKRVSSRYLPSNRVERSV